MLAASDGPDLDDVLTVLVRHEPDYVLVTVAGEVDFASVAGLRERLFTLASAGRPLVADLDRVSFIDAAGLGVLAGAARRPPMPKLSEVSVAAPAGARTTARRTARSRTW
jgi:ABC-type transporter Mla MlaB component